MRGTIIVTRAKRRGLKVALKGTALRLIILRLIILRLIVLRLIVLSLTILRLITQRLMSRMTLGSLSQRRTPGKGRKLFCPLNQTQRLWTWIKQG